MSQTGILLEAGTNELEIVEFYIDEPERLPGLLRHQRIQGYRDFTFPDCYRHAPDAPSRHTGGLSLPGRKDRAADRHKQVSGQGRREKQRQPGDHHGIQQDAHRISGFRRDAHPPYQLETGGGSFSASFKDEPQLDYRGGCVWKAAYFLCWTWKPLSPQ